MNPSAPAARRPRPARTNRATLPATPTLRLLEVACGLDRREVENLLATSPRPRAHFPERPSELNAHQALGVILCGLLLSAIVAALIVSLA